MTLTGGKRNIEEALKQTRRILNMARPSVPYIVFLITYGRQAPDFGSPRLQEAARSLWDTGADIYVIGVGVDESDPQLQSAVKKPIDFFEIPTSDDLRSNVRLIAFYAAYGISKSIQLSWNSVE